MKNQVAIAIGLLAGLALGLAAATTDSPPLMALAKGVQPIGTAFVNLLRMVVIPLVVTTIFSGVAGVGNLKGLGKLGAFTLIFFWSTTLVAIMTGMASMHLALPLVPEGASASGAASQVSTDKLPGAVDFLLSLIPANPFKAAADGALLPLIVFTVLFGAASSALRPRDRDSMIALADAVSAALVKLVFWILRVAPLGVFALAAPVIATSGVAVLQGLGIFIGAVILGLVLFIALVYLPLVTVIGRVPLGRFLRACLAPETIAFTTSSSAAALPSMLQSADKELGISRPLASLILPVGAALNRSGSALFQGAAVVFLAALYNVPLGWAGLAGALAATFLVSLSIAAVPSASIVSLAPALTTVGIPLDGLGILLGLDRIPDMFRTATNVTGDVAAAAIMDGLARRRPVLSDAAHTRPPTPEA